MTLAATSAGQVMVLESSDTLQQSLWLYKVSHVCVCCVCIYKLSLVEPGRGLRFSESNTDQEGAVSVTEGDPLSLNCSVEDGVGMVEFQWLLQRAGREEEELQERGRVNVSSTANTSVLVIPKTAVEDEGEYSCVVADCLTHIKRNFTVSIIGEPASQQSLSLARLIQFVRS